MSIHWKPRLGESVIFKGYIANHADTHPAVITRVHGAGEGALVNLTVFPDLQSPKVYPSVPVYSSRSAAEGDIVGAPGRHNGYAYLLD